MNYPNMKFSVRILALAAFGMVACDDSLTLGQLDEAKYESSKHSYAFLECVDFQRKTPLVELRTEGTEMEVRFGLTKAADHAVDARLTVDASYAKSYNQQHETDFEVFPADLVTIEEQGAVLLAPGKLRSEPIAVSLKSGDALVQGRTYLLPIAISPTDGDIRLNEPCKMILVKFLGTLPDAAKTPDIKIFSCMEVNDTNPLNNLPFTLKKSGKQLIDAVILFSANINYNDEIGRVYVNMNQNVAALLNNREKYLKPLQDRGIKVILGILGNHDISGVANLSDATAAAFANELKYTCDAYQLDGIFYDDEYSNYPYSNIPPAFVPASQQAAMRLCYETKRAMPDKWCVVYSYSTTGSCRFTVDGLQAVDFIDYTLADYASSTYPSNYLGFTMKQCSHYSQQFNYGTYASEGVLQQIRDDGYGAHMIFAMDPNRGNASSQIAAMERMARIFYDDELVDSGERYPKDWIK